MSRNFGPCKFLMLARINLAWAFFAVIAILWNKEHLTVLSRNGSAKCIRGTIFGPETPYRVILWNKVTSATILRQFMLDLN